MNTLMKTIQVSIVVPFKIEGDVLSIWMQRRESSDELKGLLEFPGGKVEKEETPFNAAIREVQEETGVGLEAARLMPNMTYKSSLKDKTVVLNIFTYKSHGEFAGGWYKVEEIDRYFDDIPPANKKFLKDVIKSIS